MKVKKKMNEMNKEFVSLVTLKGRDNEKQCFNAIMRECNI
jgi:hypothetical protein